MKKILIVLDNMKMGGSERQALVLARGLRDNYSVKIKVIALQSPVGQTLAICDQLGIEWSMLSFTKPRNPLKFIRNLLQVALAFRRERPYAIIPFTRRANVVTGLIWRLTGASTAVWNQRTAGETIMSERLDRLAGRQIPHLVANSQQAADFLAIKFGRPSSQVHIIYNGVESRSPKHSAATWLQRLQLGGNRFSGCMVANIHDLKDHATLISAWKVVTEKLTSHGIDARLFLAGRPGSTYEALQSQAEKLALHDNVRFLGEVEDVAGLLACIDIGLHSSLNEGCPNGVLECMQAGLPVVATHTPGIAETVGKDNTPFLSPPKDPATMADLIVDLALQKELRSCIGKKNELRVREEYAVEKMLQKFAALIGIN